MLTPVEMQSKTFKSGGLGYDKKDVDAYMKEVLRSYETIYRENMELKDRVSVLSEGIQYYKSIEKTLQKALILAEKTAQETRDAANRDAKRIEKEAAVKANIMLADAKNELEKLHNQTIELIQQYEKYKAQFKSLAMSQIELLDSDAYSINIARLDAFISKDVPSQKSDEQKVDIADFMEKANPSDTSDDSDGVKEITARSNENNAPSISYDEAGYEDYDFSDFEVDGQEEFDFLNLSDNEE